VKSIGKFLACVIFFAAPFSNATEFHCGGDGPKPFDDITGSLHFQVNAVNTNSGVDEFLYFQNRDSLIYRNGANQILNLSSDGTTYDTSSYLNTSEIALDRIMDPSERYVLTAGVGWILDTQTHNWTNFMDGSPQHLFWNNETLYSMTQGAIDSATVNYQIFSYTAGDSAAAQACSFNIASPSGITYGLSRGHEYPYVYFYTSEQLSTGYVLHNYRYNIEKCAMEDEQTSFSGIKGAILAVDRFQPSGSVAVTVDDPHENLLWWTSQSCGYYDISQLTPMVPDHHQPIVATWSKDQGVKFLFLDLQKEASLLSGFPIKQVTERDIWISPNQQHVFLSPLFEGESYRWLMGIKNLNLNPINMDLASGQN
jgi:hypothetical protein